MSDSPKQRKAETPLPPPAPPALPAAPAPEAARAPEAGAPVKVGRMQAKLTELPPFRVVLHDDERVDMTHVVRSIVELTPLSAPLARDVMLSAHEHGSAQVLVTHQERAELYQEQFVGKGLMVTIEPAA